MTVSFPGTPLLTFGLWLPVIPHYPARSIKFRQIFFAIAPVLNLPHPAAPSRLHDSRTFRELRRPAA